MGHPEGRRPAVESSVLAETDTGLLTLDHGGIQAGGSAGENGTLPAGPLMNTCLPSLAP